MRIEPQSHPFLDQEATASMPADDQQWLWLDLPPSYISSEVKLETEKISDTLKTASSLTRLPRMRLRDMIKSMRGLVRDKLTLDGDEMYIDQDEEANAVLLLQSLNAVNAVRNLRTRLRTAKRGRNEFADQAAHEALLAQQNITAGYRALSAVTSHTDIPEQRIDQRIFLIQDFLSWVFCNPKRRLQVSRFDSDKEPSNFVSMRYRVADRSHDISFPRGTEDLLRLTVREALKVNGSHQHAQSHSIQEGEPRGAPDDAVLKAAADMFVPR